MEKRPNIELRQVFERDKEGWVEYPSSLWHLDRVSFAKPKHWPDTWAIRRRDGFVYVQGEDAHGLMEQRMEDAGYTPRYTQWAVSGFAAWLKSDQWPHLQKWKGDK